MLALPPNNSGMMLPKYQPPLYNTSNVGNINSSTINPLLVYLSNSIKRDLHMLLALGAIKESGVKVIHSYLPYATAGASVIDGKEEEDILNAFLSPATSSSPLSADNIATDSWQLLAPRSMSSTDKNTSGDLEHSRPPNNKKLNRQRSETAPLRPTSVVVTGKQQQQQQQQQKSKQQIQTAPLSPSAVSPRKEKSHHRHERLGAKLGAFFNKLTLDSETSPRLRNNSKTSSSSGGGGGGGANPLSPVSVHDQQPPQYKKTMSSSSATNKLTAVNFQRQIPTGSSSLATLAEETKKSHERSFSDSSPRSPPEMTHVRAAVHTNETSSSKYKPIKKPVVSHRQTVSHCQTPPLLGFTSPNNKQLSTVKLEFAGQQPRKSSQNSQRSSGGGSSNTDCSSSGSMTVATGGYASSQASSSRGMLAALMSSGASTNSSKKTAPSKRSSGVSTLNVGSRKRSFTHLGLSMESMPSSTASPQQQQQQQQLRRAKPATNFAAAFHNQQQQKQQPAASKLTETKNSGLPEGMARLAAPANSLGLVLQSSSNAVANAASISKNNNIRSPLASAPPTRSTFGGQQRHHNSVSMVNSSSTGNNSGGGGGGGGGGGLAFPPMPSEACQAAMLSASSNDNSSAEVGNSLQLSLMTASNNSTQRRQSPSPSTPPTISKALSDNNSIGDHHRDSGMLVVATATYNYTSNIKGDLEFVKGERILVQSKVNDDWWFGSIVPESGRGSTGRSGMFPRSHISFK